ncbi:PAS domain S-box protein [Flavobacterium sp. CHNK8]|uniref:PAS domain S-box protein n=1 Tax=Flavobacterium sp. CHNK8 TaxID=2871165 RepID=UPI001C8ED1A3|nr:PAS domain S-box protein [Flavobacterium sp. CHNK8]QZK91008.1 PAS domain S-box protein [Flavobacterium sp. CHNK8]
MTDKQFANLFVEQSKDLIWIIDSHFKLIYANKAYQNAMTQVNGKEKKLDEPIFTVGFGDGSIEKWKSYFVRGLNGEHFEIEDQFYNPTTNQVEYSQISFHPIIDENRVVASVACQLRDITSIIKSNTEAEIIMDASLDVICSIDEQGFFKKVNAACKELWGYEKHELVGRAYIDFVIDEDVEKTNAAAADILSGKNVTTFENSYKRKDGGIAFNLWSVRYDPKSKIMFCVARDAREKIQKEELLIESENRFKALVQEGSDMISIIDAAGNYIYTSPNTTAILGITPEEFDGNSIFDFIHPDDIEKSAAYIQRISTENKVIVEPFRLRDGKNEWRWIETVLTNMLDNLAVNGIVANSRDITEEKKLEKLNKQTNDLGKIGTWEYDLIENKLFWSDEVYYLHDVDPGTFVPNVESAIDFYKEEHKSYVTDEITKSLTQGVYLDYEAVIITRSNKEKWVRVIGSPEFIEGKCAKFIGSFQDTTDLREAESRLQSLSDNIPGVVFTYLIHPDGSDEFKYVSKGSEKIWGYSPEEVKDNSDLVWNQVKAGGDFEVMKQSISDSTENKSQWYMRFSIVRADGEKRLLQGLGTPEFLSNGTVQYNSVVLDITEEAKNEELLEQASNLARIGSWEVDLKKNKILWTEMVHQLHETNPQSFKPDLAQSINFYREDFKPMITEAVNQCIQLGTSFDFEAVVVTANKNELWVRAIGNAEFINGECVRIYGSFQDIHKRKEAEIRLQSLSDNLPGVVYTYIIHPDGTDSMQFISGMVEKMWGYTTNEVMQNIDLLWDQIKQGGDIEEVKSSVAKSIETKSKWTCRFKIVNHNGEIRTHFGSGTPIFLADGTILFHVMVLDITQEAKNEELLEEVTNMARVGSWELDLINQDGESIYWSPILREIVEVDDSYNPTLTGGIEFHVGESKERIQKALDLLISDGIEFDEEVLLRSPKGNERWNRCIGKREMVNGKCIRIYGSYQDIHQRKESQLELLAAIKKTQESDARFKSYTQQSPIAIYTTDINGDCIYANETWLEMAEMQLEDALGKGWINALHPEDMDYVTDNWYKLIESNDEWNYEYRFLSSNKNIIWVNGSAKKLFNDKNEHIGYLGSNVDITERKKAEQDKNSLLATLEKSLNEIYVFDAKTLKFTYVNQCALNNIGYSEQEIKELTPLDLNPEFTGTTYNQLINQLITKEKEKIIFFTNHKRKNGNLYPVEIHLQFIVEGNNKRFLAVILDITERKQSEVKLLDINKKLNIQTKELQRSNEQLEQFALSRSQYVMQMEAQNEKLRNIAWTQSHLVRAPLSRILGIINLIEMQRDNLDDLMFCLKQLRVSSDEMDAIIRKITEEAQEIQLNKINE